MYVPGIYDVRLLWVRILANHVRQHQDRFGSKMNTQAFLLLTGRVVNRSSIHHFSHIRNMATRTANSSKRFGFLFSPPKGNLVQQYIPGT